MSSTVKKQLRIVLLKQKISQVMRPFWTTDITLASCDVQSTRTQSFWKPFKQCHFGIHWIAPSELSQMSTHVSRFQSFFSFFLHNFVLAKSANSSIRINLGWIACDFSLTVRHLTCCVPVFAESLRFWDIPVEIDEILEILDAVGQPSDAEIFGREGRQIPHLSLARLGCVVGHPRDRDAPYLRVAEAQQEGTIRAGHQHLLCLVLTYKTNDGTERKKNEYNDSSKRIFRVWHLRFQASSPKKIFWFKLEVKTGFLGYLHQWWSRQRRYCKF